MFGASSVDIKYLFDIHLRTMSLCNENTWTLDKSKAFLSIRHLELIPWVAILLSLAQYCLLFFRENLRMFERDAQSVCM